MIVLSLLILSLKNTTPLKRELDKTFTALNSWREQFKHRKEQQKSLR